MKYKFQKVMILFLLSFVGGVSCSGNLRKASVSPGGVEQKSDTPNSKDSSPKKGSTTKFANTSQPALLEVQSTLTFPDQQAIVAKLYFYSPSALKPEESKLDIRQILENENSAPQVSLLIVGENDQEAKEAVLKSTDGRTFEIQTAQATVKNVFQLFSVRMGTDDSTIKNDFKLDSSTSFYLPRPIFLLKKGTIVRETPLAEDILDQVILNRTDLGAIGKIFVLKDETKTGPVVCRLEVKFSEKEAITSFELINIGGDAHLLGGKTQLDGLQSGTVGENAFVVCRNQIQNVPGKNVKYSFLGETRTNIPRGVLIQ